MKRSARGVALLITLGAATLDASIFAQQEKPSPTSDYQYRKDYAEVEVIQKEADPQKRADKLLAFVKEHPLSRMIPYVWGYYVAVMADNEKAAAWDKVFAMHEQWLALRADDVIAQKSLMGAYFRGKKLDKAAELGEKLYAQSKDKALLGDLLALYQQLQATDKWAATADKVLAEYPIEQSYGTAVQLSLLYAGKNELDKSAAYAAKVTGPYGETTPPGAQEAAWKTTRTQLFSIQGAVAYKAKDWPKAIELYEKAAKADAKNDAAHYYVGMGKWQNKDLDGAIEAFARASVLNKTMAKKAQEYLEQLYKPRNNNTLDGLDQVLAKAKSEVGVS